MSWNYPSDKDRVEIAVARGLEAEAIAVSLQLPLTFVLDVIAAMERVNNTPDEEHHGNVRTGAA